VVLEELHQKSARPVVSCVAVIFVVFLPDFSYDKKKTPSLVNRPFVSELARLTSERGAFRRKKCLLEEEKQGRPEISPELKHKMSILALDTTDNPLRSMSFLKA
jgi:hypothetical protein